MIGGVAEPLLRESLDRRFVEGFTEHVREAGADPEKYAEIEWTRRWLSDPVAIGAVRRGLASWLADAGRLLPDGLAARLQLALLALNKGEPSWLAQIERAKGQSAKQFTKEQFALIFCQEVEYLSGRHGWTRGRAFFELTGNRPRRDAEVSEGQERELTHPAISGLAFPTFERLRRTVPKPMLDAARNAGEGERTGRELAEPERAFIAGREARVAAYDAGALAAMWRDVQEGSAEQPHGRRPKGGGG